jgi:hypothetical protein
MEWPGRIHLTAAACTLVLVATWNTTSAFLSVWWLGAFFYIVCYLVFVIFRIIAPLIGVSASEGESKPPLSGDLWDREIDG